MIRGLASVAGFSADSGTLYGIGAEAPSAPEAWDIKSGQRRFRCEGAHDPWERLAVCAEGALVSVSRRWIAVWDGASGALRRQIRWRAPESLRGIRALLLDQRGVTLVAWWNDGNLSCWDLSGDEQPRTWAAGAGATSVALSPSGEFVAVAHEAGIALWRCADASLVLRRDDHGGRATAVTFLWDERYLATAGCDSTVLVYALASLLAGGARGVRLAPAYFERVARLPPTDA